jgi:nicotinamidase/pyrazinamidase
MNRQFQNSALLVVDIQNDFCPGGALGIQDGDRVIPIVNKLMPLFPLVLTTQDWHPANHCSFLDQGGIWPPHCVQNTTGAELHTNLNRKEIDHYFFKAFTAAADAYSGFDGFDENRRGLIEVLQEKKITRLYIAGLATDYCVKATAIDAIANGYDVYVITDAIQAVNVHENDGEKALAELAGRGAQLINSVALVKKARRASASGESSFNRT